MTSGRRVLLVDDHRGVLERVSGLLSARDFDVAGLATGGRQAIDLARDVEPDAIVLDVSMPGLDGFQTIEQLRRDGSNVPVVFLSVQEEEEILAEAFRRGGRGYVVKSRLVQDLASALEHVLHGRLFVPSVTALSSIAAGGGHAMQLHDDPKSCADDVAALLDVALRRGDATCVIATADVRDALGRRLRALGWDWAGHKRCRVIDADDALSGFIRDGLPDPELLASIAAELDDYRRTVAEAAASRLTIFGNMVMSLSRRGNTDAMIALEQLWNTVTRGLAFLTLCGYARSCFHDTEPDLWSQACAQHWAVSHTGESRARA